MPKKIVITGANGMLGKYLHPLFSQKSVHYFSHRDLEITNAKQVKKFFKEIKPEIVYHLAAMTNVDQCEIEPKQAFEVNCKGTENIATECAKYNSQLVYISSGMVFDGNKEEPYNENDTVTSCANIYGKTKYQGEQIVRKWVKKHYIVRTTWLFGGHKQDKKFVQKMLQLATKNRVLQVVDDKWGSPTYTKDLAEALVALTKNKQHGLYHFANKGRCNRAQFAKKIFAYSKLNCEVKPVNSSRFPTPAPRPYNEAITSLKLSNIRNWEQALEEYCNTI